MGAVALIHQFTIRGTEGRKVAIDMSCAQSVLEEETCTCIVTASESYYVIDDYDVVVDAWLKTRKE